VLELHERVDATGKVVVALDESRAEEAIAAFIERYQLDSVAVTFLWSFANPAHELAVDKLVRSVAPGVFVSVSSRVSPRLGEFERTVATVLNGYIGPACTRYLTSMGERLAADGLRVPLLVIQSSGGVVPVSVAAQIALGTLDSGPTAGLTGVAALAPANGHRNVVATDMGGTSFDIGLVICWVANVLHHSDIGGPVVGSLCIDAPDIFTDPSAFPPFKIVEGGRVRTDMEQVFLRQSRLPGVVQMDLRAAIDAGEQLFTERLRQIPDGTWSHRVYAEASHTGDAGLYRYQLTVRKRGDELVVDNAGTDPQAGSINVTYAGLVGAFLAALTASLTPDLAGAYGGVYRRVRFEPVPGTLSCADFPAAVSPAGVFTMELLISLSGSVIAKMVACGPPELRDGALGPSQPHWYGTIIAGQHASGAPYIAVNANNMVGALPASADADGADFGGHFWIPEGIASNIEETEQLYPMLCLYRRALRCGADGAGAHRGGRSITEAFVPWDTPGMAAALYVDDSFPKAVGPFEWVSLSGRARLGPVTGDYRAACAVLDTPVNAAPPEFAARPGRPGAAMLLREYLCPVTGLRLATELIRAGDDPAPDMVLAG